jgi:two-component system, OmpR family, heavy metal sensor histidine kinase CusS
MSFADVLTASPAQKISAAIVDRTKHATLATRLSVAYFATSFLMIVTTCAILYWADVSALNWADDQVLEKRLLTLREHLQQSELSAGFLAHEVTEDLEGPRRLYMRIVSHSEPLRIETPGFPTDVSLPSVSAKPLDTGVRGTVETADQSFRFLTVRVPIAAHSGSSSAVLQGVLETSLDEEVLAWFRYTLIGIFLAALVVCWVTARLLVSRELRPLNKITAAARQITGETLTYRLPLEKLPAELDELARQFNSMLSRLESTYMRLRQYADNIAHELRSPLNKMLLGCEVALLGSRSNQEYRESLLSSLEECKRLSRITQNLLFLARAENGRAKILREEVQLARELEVMREFFSQAAADARVTLSVFCASKITLNVDRALFQRAITNLVMNAIAHTPEGGCVTIKVQRHAEQVTIDIIDTGAGIAPEHVPYVFDRFYRVDQVRSSEDDHLGLGLPITKSIVELHGGSITLESEVGRGTIVTLAFSCRSFPD